MATKITTAETLRKISERAGVTVGWCDDLDTVGGMVSAAAISRADAMRVCWRCCSAGMRASWAPDAGDAMQAWVYVAPAAGDQE
jgi:hypothetical protein